MKKLALPLLAVVFLTIPSVASGSKSKLYGKWQVTKMEMGDESKKQDLPPGMKIVVEFAKNNVFKVTMSFRGKSDSKTGTWKIVGKGLETSVEGKTEQMDYKVRGRVLKIIQNKSGKKQIMTLKKL